MAGQHHSELAIAVQRLRAAHEFHAVATQPGAGGIEQGGDDGHVINGVQRAEKTDGLAIMRHGDGVDLRGNAPDRLAPAHGQEILRPPRAEKGVLAWGEQVALGQVQRGGITGQPGVQAAGQLDEGGHLTKAGNGNDSKTIGFVHDRFVAS